MVSRKARRKMTDTDDEEIDDEQVEDYCAMLDKLGRHPDKVAINSLSMAAEDFSESTRSDRIVDTSISPDNKLPLVYVLDSLLKNVKGVYVEIILGDASNWMSAVYNIFDKASNKENEKARLKRVWDSWRHQGVVKDDSRWKKIGECFSAPDVKQTVPASPVIDLVSGGGFPRNVDGSLKIESELRKQMQLLLDDVQSSGVDELDKVSLERLAEINPDLLQQIKEGAEAAIIDLNKTTTSQTRPQHQAAITETKPVVGQAHQSEWAKLNIKHTEQSNKLITSLHQQVISASQSTTVVKSELDDVVHLYASVSAAAQIMTDMLQQFTSGTNIFGGDCEARSDKRRRYSIVKPEDFTNDGIKKRNDAVIAQLYEVGLPFVCSADGRRFGTQLELSKHLDALFKKSQIEKTMEKTEERAWYRKESLWITGSDESTHAMDELNAGASSIDNPVDVVDASSYSVIADETRDRCPVCGVNFDMFFDDDDGEWRYKNCVEKAVENDGPTLEEDETKAVLLKYTCWLGLGSPEVLTSDMLRHAS
ncbi:hypothetical protein THAOC_31007 [Thalassiosira oceanica]|uniref:Uncharacterized protein n=1 Tax=Thalassiosira oceanica TaxID=159749 RepID=K0RTS3_THAOC|nr:hypothetical protein THAOC_31007 [Thalassiosira oceanica]|eukprot:EJK50067.1 hypothetical protein THAOC_31007 [Thalassiosira oceanica]